MRRGDVVISWACDDHLVHVVKDLQRDNEITELIVTDARKALAAAEYQRALDRIGRDSRAAAEVDRLRDA